MIQDLQLKNFKCFKNTKLNFGSLTILCGQNNAGKSSAIHAILLTRQAMLNAAAGSSIRLNGPFGVNLGTAFDVFHNGAEDKDISFEYSFDDLEEKATPAYQRFNHP